METLEDTSLTHRPLSYWKGQGHVHGCSGWFIFCNLGELNLILIIVMEHSTLVSRANALQSFIRSWELNCQLALTQLLLFAMTERRRRRSRKEESLLRGASAAGVASRKLNCSPGATSAFLITQTSSKGHQRARGGPVTVHSRQNEIDVTLSFLISEPQWHHQQEQGKPHRARWRHRMCITDVCIPL